jgi:hypothetical protein
MGVARPLRGLLRGEKRRLIPSIANGGETEHAKMRTEKRFPSGADRASIEWVETRTMPKVRSTQDFPDER